MKIIGISGKMGVGKSTVAASLIPKANDITEKKWTRRSFGDAIKEEVSEKFGIDLSLLYHEKNALIDMSEFYYTLPPKRKMTIREILQWWGTDVRRSEKPNYWTHKMANWLMSNQLKYEGVIIDDVRFYDEAEFLRDNGAMLIRIEPYPDYEMKHRISTHQSETDLDVYVEWDMVFSPGFGDLQFVADEIFENYLK